MFGSMIHFVCLKQVLLSEESVQVPFTVSSESHADDNVTDLDKVSMFVGKYITCKKLWLNYIFKKKCNGYKFSSLFLRYWRLLKKH
jgi:hypothetical protein